MEDSRLLLAVAAFVLLAVIVGHVMANEPKVKYCKNLETGEIIVVQEGYPCPFPTVKI